jgi:hypothetical protein
LNCARSNHALDSIAALLDAAAAHVRAPLMYSIAIFISKWVVAFEQVDSIARARIVFGGSDLAHIVSINPFKYTKTRDTA